MSMGGGNEQGFQALLGRLGVGGMGDNPVGGGQLPWGPKPAAPADGEAAAEGPDKAGLFDFIRRQQASLSDAEAPASVSDGPYQNVGGRRSRPAGNIKPVGSASASLAERLAAAKAKREEKKASLDEPRRGVKHINPFNDPMQTGRDANGNATSGFGVLQAHNRWDGS